MAIVLWKLEKRLAKPLSSICKDFSLHLQWFYSSKKLQSITFDSNKIHESIRRISTT